MNENPAVVGHAESDLFKGLTVEQRQEIIRHGISKRLQSKNVLFYQGDAANVCYLVNRGRLKLSMLGEQGKEVIIRYAGAGDLTAAATVLKDRAYPATAETVEVSEIIGWDKPTLLSLMENFPPFAINILYIVLERMEELQNRYREISTEQVDQRVARALLRLMQRAGLKTPEGIRIDIPLSRQNIADYTGTTMFTVSRVLSVWERKGWLKSGRGRIVITDPHSLVQFAETA